MKKLHHIMLGVIIASLFFQGNVLAQNTDAVIKEITGLVQVQKANQTDWIKAQENSTVTSGDKIRSFLESSALLIFPDSSEFRLRENTSLDIKDISQNPFDKSAKRELKLNLGSLHYKVPPKKERATEFKIHSSTSIVGITGTEGIITAKGDQKPSENILIEGATYNTNDQGLDGRYQRKGNVYVHDGETIQLFSAQVEEEVESRMQISEIYTNSIKEAVALYKTKKDGGYKVADAQTMIDQAFFYLEKRQYDLAAKMIRQANTLLGDVKKITMPEGFDGKIKETLAQIQEKETGGYDVSKAYSLAGKIQDLKQSGYFNEIKQAITQVEKELALLTEGGSSGGAGKTFSTYYEDIQRDVLEKERRGFVLSEIKSILRQSQVFYEQGDAPKAYQLLDEVKDKLSFVLKKVSDALKGKIDRLENDITLKKENAYSTKELELRLEKVKGLIKAEDFLKARDLVAVLEEGILILSKSVSAEWKLKINNLKRDVTYKRSIGYDLSQIYDLMGELEDYQAQGDLVKLELTFTQAQKDLKGLKLPAGFQTNWKEFIKAKKDKEAMGYSIKEVDDLNIKIENAVNKGDIKSARSFLNQAKKLLVEMKDQEPPKVQILAYKEEEGLITIEGYASDNTKIKNVSVNNSIIELSDDGRFIFNTVPASVNRLSVLARDIQGNISAPVNLEVEGVEAGSDIQGEITGEHIEYSDNEIIVKGKFAPGGQVKVGEIEAVCNDKGRFAVMIRPDKDKAMDIVTVVGVKSGGVTTDEVTLTIEDKWVPEINIEKISFNDNFVPSLKIDPLEYRENKLLVSGEVGIMQMANLDGHVRDLGRGIESLKVDGRDVEVRKDGAFSVSLTIDPSRKDLTVKIIATDKANNMTEAKTALDAAWNLPAVKINTHKTFLNSSGKFSKEITITEDVDDVTVVLEDSKGQVIVSKRLPVAAVLPPELEIQDIRYEGPKVYISGRITSDAVVSEKNKTIFTEDLETTKNTVFTLSAEYPAVAQEVIFIATNIEGKTSQEVRLAVGPPNDTKAPVLYISSPVEDNKKIIIKGFVDDDSDVKEVTVHGTPVTVSLQKSFSHEIEFSQDLKSVDVVAVDIFGNKAKKIIALKDKEAPKIVINTWEAKEGRLIISGEVSDNIGVKEVRLNDMPIVHGSATKLAFSYRGALTGASQEAVIIAVDLLNNESREGPRKLEMPADTDLPKGKSIGLEYGSPIVYASGEVSDPAGVKAVYVNGEEVALFDDGTFHIKVDINVGLPKVTLESPAYNDGKVTIAGKAALGDFDPAKITVESEDLSGNRGVLFTQEVTPYQLNELEVAINGEVVEINEEGGFSYEQPILLGEMAVEVKVRDPFDNSLLKALDLENKKPVLELNPLEYNADNELVVLSGSAADEGSGLYTVGVNGIRVDLGEDGSFSYTATFDQGYLNVVAMDYIGNVTSLTQKVDPPDVWPPVFSLNITPTPSIIGDPVYVEIAALDSNTRLPEILAGAPTVTADADGVAVLLTVDGEGANYMATLDTTGLNAALVTVKVHGEDEDGNSSSDIEGDDAFVLVEDDAIVPSFTVETVPSPMELGEESKITVYASEDLQEIPTLEAMLPSGGTNALELSSVNSGEYESSLTVPVEEGIGTVLLKLNGGKDLSGNVHGSTETSVEIVAPVIETELPLNIHLIEFLANRLTLSGQTASEAIVHVEAGKYFQDIVANAEGMFRLERPVSLEELEEMHTINANIRVMLRAHNYAGFESRQRFLEIPLPALPELGGANFEIRVNPSPAGQGDVVNINVDPRSSVSETPRGFLYLPDGTRAVVDLQGQDIFTAQYLIAEDTALGPAMFEVVSGNIRESIGFEIVLSDEWMQRLNKYEFFKIRVSSDPLIIGESAQFFVETMGELPMPPRLEIMLPNGQRESIPLTGSGRNFQGSYRTLGEVMPGSAELILNPGMPEEVRRPYGVEDPFSQGDYIDAFLFANPNPLIGGEPYDVSLSFSQDVPFRPRLVLRFQDGRSIEMPLEGSAPSNRFTARGTLPGDIGTGLAKFILYDDQGMVIDTFPAQVAGSLTTSAGVDIFVVPDMLHHMDMATIQLNSITSTYDRVEAHISYPDGTKMIVSLEGSGTVMQGSFVVPAYVPLGMITISVFGEDGDSLGSINAQVTEYGDMGGPINIFLDNPNFQPFDSVQLNVEANWPLPFIPNAELLWDTGSMNIYLNGQVPGNRFMGNFMAPSDPIEHGRIEIRDDRGIVIGDFPLDHGPEGEGEIIVTPMPPVIGQPLSIKIVAPSVVDSAPTMRLLFDDGGQMELNAYGPVPGDTFTASMAVLDRPLRVIEIIHDGQVVESIPVEYLMESSFEFFVDIMDEVYPCDMTDIIVRSDSFVPFLPYLSVDFQGRIVDVPLSKMSPTEFLGRLSVPCDAAFDSFNMRIFDPQGKLLWQRNFSYDMNPDGLIALDVMPIGDTSLDLRWDLLSGIEDYEIRYGQTAAFGQNVLVQGVENYILSGLQAGMTYFVQVAARKDYQDIMVSDIVEALVGRTTMELNVQENIVGDDVQLIWTEYAGADAYRVQWGTVSLAYDHSVDVTTTDYYITGLDINAYNFIKVDALQNDQVIGESREIFVNVEEFQSTGGEIYLTPSMPVIGEYFEIDIHFFADLPYTPEVMVRLQNRDISLMPSGQYRDYTTYLTGSAFDSPIVVIDVLDLDGTIIATLAPSSGGTFGDPAATINVMPEPPVIGTTLQVDVDFSEPPGFTPRLMVEFASGTREYIFSQGPGMDTYQLFLPVADMNSSILYMKVMDPYTDTMVAERVFSASESGGYDDMPFTVTPNPPMIGQSVEMELDTDTVVSWSPKLKIYYASGTTRDVTMWGAEPGQHFTYSISDLNSLIDKIDIIDPVSNIVKHTWTPGATVSMSCDVVLQYDPPQIGQLLQVRAEFPGPVSFVPKIHVYLDGATKTYMFPQDPGMSIYEIFIPAADITSRVNEIEITDDMNNAILCERFFDADVPVNVTTLTVTPNPPVIGQDIQVHVEFNMALGFTPRWRMDTINGSFSGDFSQGSGYTVYNQIIASGDWTGTPVEIEIQDDFGAYISGGEIFFDVSESFTCAATFSPNPPAPYTSLVVTAGYQPGSEPTYNPWVFIEFDGGELWSQAFPQGAYMENYSMTIPGSYITDHVIRVGVGDYPRDVIDCGEDFSVGAVDVTLTVIPDPPAPWNDLDVTATFSSNAPFIPELFIELDGGTTRKDYIFPNGAGFITYQMTIPGADITGPVDRVGVEDDLGSLLEDIVFSNQTFEITSIAANGSDKIDLCWTYDNWIDEYRIYYGTASGSYDGSGSPVPIGNQSCYLLGAAEILTSNTTYYVKVEAFDAGTFMFGSPEEMITLTSSTVEYPMGLWTETTGVVGEIKIHWDSVSGVDGYRVYYGTTSWTYNESGSPLEIADSSATQAVISSLLDNTQYFITVEAYIGAMESNNPSEVASYPGTGSGALTANPSTLSVSGNPGAPISSQTVIINNNGMAVANVRSLSGDLIFGVYSISSDQFTITPSLLSIPSGNSENFTVNLDVPTGIGDGLYAGSIKFYSDMDSDSMYDDGEAFVDVSVSLTVASVSVDHVRITADASSSAMGSPIFVTLTAEDVLNNIVTSYGTDVTINVSESSGGQITNSWNLSTNDGPGGSSSSTVGMFNGIGNFTVDALEPENLTINLSGVIGLGDPLVLEFTPNPSGSGATDWAIIVPNRAPSGSNQAVVWIAAVDNSGLVVTDFAGTVNLTATGDGPDTPTLSITSHIFALVDNGQIQITVTDGGTELVTLGATGSGLNPASEDIDFVLVTQYLVYSSSTAGTSFTTDDTTINLTLRAADVSSNIVRSYSETATFTTGDVDAYLSDGSTVQFNDGLAQIVLNNSQSPETVSFTITETSGTPTTGSIGVDFQASGPRPEIVRVEMDTPWIVHVYFSENVTSATAGIEGNYTVGVSINKVCWYGDNVTLHLDAIPGGGLGGSFNLDVINVTDEDGLHVAYPAALGTSVSYSGISVPDVDYQGASFTGGTDWFEVQVSDTTPGVGNTVRVTVYHKNVCGYLTGSNQTNRNTVLDSIFIEYTGSLGITGLTGSPPTSGVDISSGKAEFDVTTGSSSGTVTISAAGGGVSTQLPATITIP